MADQQQGLADGLVFPGEVVQEQPQSCGQIRKGFAARRANHGAGGAAMRFAGELP